MPSIAEPQPSSTQPALDPSSRQQLIRNISIGAVIVCPLIIALPPRKIDIYTVGLVGGTLWGANNIALEYTGRSIVTRAQDRMRSATSPSLPPKALEVQARLREEKAQRLVEKHGVNGAEGLLEELRKEEEKQKRGILKSIWLGGEDEDWKRKRDQREKEALERGEGYGDLIMDQIKEVFGKGKEKLEEVKEVDEEVVEKRRQENGKK